MKRKILNVFIILFLMLNVSAQETVFLYKGKAPGSEDWNYKEIEYSNPGMPGKMIRNVVDPTLSVYVPEKSIASGTAVIICPGGGNVWLSYGSEGTDVAEWLAKKGVTAFVLKYRLNKTPEDLKEFENFVQNFMSGINDRFVKSEGSPDGPPPPSITTDRYYGGDDGLKAMEYVREHASLYGIDPNKVGIMGFSAGAGVTMHVILNSASDKQPNFAAPIYGGWLRDSEVPDNAPPLFILSAADDPIAAGSPGLYKAWRDKGLSAELHIYSKGGHGFGMSQNGLPVNKWIERFYDWMTTAGF